MQGDKVKQDRAPVSVEVLDRKRQTVGALELDSSVFGVPVREHLLHQTVAYQQAKHRAGTASTKTRGEVSGSNRKPWRQKGTGRARAGERTSPLWRGGGVVFGPRPRDFSIKLSKRERRAALKSALSARLSEGKLLVVDEINLERIKTRDLLDWLSDLGVEEKALIVIPAADEKLERSARNLRAVKVLRAEGLNVRDILLHELLILTRGAAEKIQEALA